MSEGKNKKEQDKKTHDVMDGSLKNRQQENKSKIDFIQFKDGGLIVKRK